MSNKRSKHVPSSPHDRKLIKELYKENRRLNRELDLLKKELDALEGRKHKKGSRNRFQNSFENSSNTEYLFSKKNYFSYIYSTIRQTSVFKIYKRIIDVIRRYTFITTSLKVISFVFVLIEASIILVVSTSAFIASLVLTLLTSHVLIIFTLFNKKECDRHNKELIKNKSVTVFFPPKGRAFEYDSYFSYLAKDSAGENGVSVIVSPYAVAPYGLHHSRKRYYNSRADGDNVLLVRRHYYFSLRRKIIDPLAMSVTEIF